MEDVTHRQLLARIDGLSEAARRADWATWDTHLQACIGRIQTRPSTESLGPLRAAMLETVGRDEPPHQRSALITGLSHQARASAGFETFEEEACLERLARAGAPTSLGRHLLLGLLGQGGMGNVWRAVHWPTGEQRAIKTLAAAASAEARAAIRREILALARLEHPHIVPILDQGTCSVAAHLGSAGRIATNAPWLAMPVLPHTLEPHLGRLPWSSIRPVLLALLDALSWAHANGVLHLDVKPANVLLERERPPYIARLTDFGLARAESDLLQQERLVGTPRYMAPEQFSRRWREWGPRTDLYCLGLLAVALVQGHPPFMGDDPRALQAAHLTQPPPRLEPAMAVPDGFEDWTARLLAKAPRDRFPNAAAAASSLLALAEPRATGVGPTPSPAVDEMITFDWLGEAVDDDEPPERTDAERPADPTDSGGTMVVPDNWRAGLVVRVLGTPALLAHRQVELTGRDAERDAVWGVLVRAATQVRTQVGVVVGMRGAGAGRLLRWVSTRASALGVARVLLSDVDGVHALGKTLRATGLQGPSLEDHLRRTAWRPPGLSVQVAMEALSGDLDACASALIALSEHKPVLLCFPGPHRPAPTLALLLKLQERSARIAVVVGVRDEERLPALGERLDAACQHPDWREVRVGPLGRPAMRQVVRSMLDLHPEVLERLVDRARGNPGYAVRTVRDWQTRQLLEPTPRGHRVAPEVEAELRPTEAEVALVDTLPDVEALELLAVFGEADPAVFSEAQHRGDADTDPTQLDALVRRRLVIREQSLIGLASPGLIDALCARAQAQGRLQTLHQMAASALASRQTPRDAGPTGRHLLAAGQAEAAIPYLLQAAQQTQDFGAALAWFDDLEDALAQASTPDEDARWLALWAGRIHIYHYRSDTQAIRRALPDYERHAKDSPEHGWRAARLSAIHSDAPLQKLEALFHEEDRDLPRRRTALDRAWYALMEGDLATCEAWVSKAPFVPDPACDALHAFIRSDVARRTGDLEVALAEARRAVRFSEDLPPQDIYLRFHLGDVLRERGDLDEADVAYLHAAELARERDTPEDGLARLNLLLTQLDRGLTPGPADILLVRRQLPQAERVGRHVLDLLAWLHVLPDERSPALEGLLSTILPGHPELYSVASTVQERVGGLDAYLAAWARPPHPDDAC